MNTFICIVHRNREELFEQFLSFVSAHEVVWDKYRYASETIYSVTFK